MVGGASVEGPLADVWQLTTGAGAGGGPVPATWRPLEPLSRPLVWHSAAVLPGSPVINPSPTPHPHPPTPPPPGNTLPWYAHHVDSEGVFRPGRQLWHHESTESLLAVRAILRAAFELRIIGTFNRDWIF